MFALREYALDISDWHALLLASGDGRLRRDPVAITWLLNWDMLWSLMFISVYLFILCAFLCSYRCFCQVNNNIASYMPRETSSHLNSGDGSSVCSTEGQHCSLNSAGCLVILLQPLVIFRLLFAYENVHENGQISISNAFWLDSVTSWSRKRIDYYLQSGSMYRKLKW